MTGRKPATANHLHLRPRTDSSGIKANIGRELQLSPNLCPSPSPLFSMAFLKIILLSLFFFFFLLATCHSQIRLSPPPCHLTLSKLFTADTSTFLEESTFEKRNTPALYPRVTAQPQPGVTESFSFFALILLLLLLFAAMSIHNAFLCFYEIKTDIWGYALPICNAVHMCIFRKKKLFFRGENKNVLFFIKRLLEVFHSGVG